MFLFVAAAWTGVFVWITIVLICLGRVPMPCLKAQGHENSNKNSNPILHRGSPQGEGYALQGPFRFIARTVFRRRAR